MTARQFAFTSKAGLELEELMTQDAKLYAYDGDRLLSFGSEKFVYDALGNPTTYRGKALQWEKGRQLKNYDGTAFTYDGRGRRLSKTHGGKTTAYTYDHDGNLIRQSDGTNTLTFLYDHSGLMGVKSDGILYYYRKNVQGDIVAILDNTGKIVVNTIHEMYVG